MTIETEQAIGAPHAIRACLPEIGGDEKVTFADLVLAHHLRQRSLYRAAKPKAGSQETAFAEAADKAYRARLERFEHDHGPIVRAYWCSYEVSAVAITQKKVKRAWWQVPRTETREYLHAETDWATRDSPELAHQLHKVDNLAVRADEILRGTSENIAMQLLLAAASHSLSYVDREEGPPRDPATIQKIVERSNAELADIRQHYRRAAENATRIVYAGGMVRGSILLAALSGLAGLVLWAAHDFGRHPASTWALLATLAAGAVGADVSVLLRMAKGSFSQDYEVGRKTTRRVAMARPFVGAAFAVMIYLLLKSGLVDIGALNNNERTIYFYSAVGFLAGFSERWARVIIGSVTGDADDAEKDAAATLKDREHEEAERANGRPVMGSG